MGADRDLVEALARRMAALDRGRDERDLVRDLAADLGLETRLDPDDDPGPDDGVDLGVADELELESLPADVLAGIDGDDDEGEETEPE